jgi:hypothetical protein
MVRQQSKNKHKMIKRIKPLLGEKLFKLYLEQRKDMNSRERKIILEWLNLLLSPKYLISNEKISENEITI